MDARDPSTPVKRKDVRKREREREWRRGGEVEASALAARSSRKGIETPVGEKKAHTLFYSRYRMMVVTIELPNGRTDASEGCGGVHVE